MELKPGDELNDQMCIRDRLVVLDVLVAGGQADLDVVVDVDRLDNVHVEAVSVDLVCDLLDLVENIPC